MISPASPDDAARDAWRVYADALAAFHADPADPGRANAVRAAYSAFLGDFGVSGGAAGWLAARHDADVDGQCRRAASLRREAA